MSFSNACSCDKILDVKRCILPQSDKKSAELYKIYMYYSPCAPLFFVTEKRGMVVENVKYSQKGKCYDRRKALLLSAFFVSDSP